jgi:hypothetical protein
MTLIEQQLGRPLYIFFPSFVICSLQDSSSRRGDGVHYSTPFFQGAHHFQFSSVNGYDCGLWNLAFNRIFQSKWKCRRKLSSIYVQFGTDYSLYRGIHLFGFSLEIIPAYDNSKERLNGIETHLLNQSVLRGAPHQMDQPDIAPQVTCPQCESREVCRTKRNGILERVLLYPLGFRAYRCEICDARFRRRIKE